MFYVFEFFFHRNSFQTTGAAGPICGVTYSKEGPTPCKISSNGTRDRLRDELRELFPELNSGIIMEVPASSKPKTKLEHHSPSEKTRRC